MSERAVVVYWGPGLSGKSTNLSVVCEVLSGEAAGGGDRVEVGRDQAGDQDRALLELGGGTEDALRLELFAPPGQPHHRHLRNSAIPEVDGVVFVADSSAGAVAANLAALDELELFLATRHRDLEELALVFQYNKRDLRDALEVSRLDELLNPGGRPSVEAIATRGVGVFPSLKAMIALLRESERAVHSSDAEFLEGIEVSDDARPYAGVEGSEVSGSPSSPRLGSGPRPGDERSSAPPKVSPKRGWLFALAVLGGALTRELVEFGWRLGGGDG